MSRTVVTGKTITINPSVRGTEGLTIPTGTTAQRPSTPSEGIIRYNTTTGQFEGYSKDPNNISSPIWTSIGGGNILDLGDVDESGITNGDILRYDQSAGNFVSSGSFSKIKVSGQTDVLATTEHELELVQGSGVVLTTDPSNGKVTIATTTATNLSTQYFTGDGNTSSFTLNQTPPTTNDILVFVDNLYQDPQSLSLTGNTLNFTANIPNGIQVVVTYLNLNTQTVTVADGAITSAKVANSAFHIDTFYGDGTSTEFTLSQTVSTPNQLFVTVGTAVKNPGIDSDYDITGLNNDKIKFTNPPSNNAVIKVRFLGVTTSTAGSIGANSVGITELNVTDGQNGQVLSTNGAGVLSFTTISGSNSLDIKNNNNTYSNPTSLEFDVNSGFTVTEASTGVLSVTSQVAFATINVTGSNQITVDNNKAFSISAGAGISVGSSNTAKNIIISADYTGVGTNLVSTTDNTYDIGTSSIAWKDIYVNSIKSSSLVLPSQFTMGTSNSVLLKSGADGLEVGQKLTIGTPSQISANEHVTLQATAGKLNIPANNIGINELDLSDSIAGYAIKTNGTGSMAFGPVVTEINTGAGLSGGPITTTGTISLDPSFNTQLGQGATAYSWGDHANGGYLTDITTQNIESLANCNFGTLNNAATGKAIVYDYPSNSFILQTTTGSWIAGSNNRIYYNIGNVGIGILANAKFQVNNQIAGTDTFRFQDGSNTELLFAPKDGEVTTNKSFHIKTNLSSSPSQPSTGGKIYFKSGKPYYVSSTLSETPLGGTVSDLGDTTISSLVSDQILKYDGNNWINVDTSSIVAANSDYSLSGLSDTTFTSLAQNEVLLYDGTKWINDDIATSMTRHEETSTSPTSVINFNYAIGNVDVYINGLKLNSSDYTATTGTFITLATPTKIGDTIEVINYGNKQVKAESIYYRQEFSGFAGTETYVDLNQAYQQGYVDCYKNGIKLRTDEFTASAQQSPWRITLASGTFQSSDKFEVIAYRTVSFADTTYSIYTKESIVAAGGETYVNSSHTLLLNHFELFFNGVKLTSADYYFISSVAVGLNFTLDDGDTIDILSWKPRQTNEVQVFATDTFNVTSTVNTLTLSVEPPSIESILVIKNGTILLAGTDYSLSQSTLTFVANLVNTDKVTVRHIQVSNSTNSTPANGSVSGLTMASVVDGDYTLIPYQYQNDDTISTVSTYGANNKNTLLVGPLTMSEQVTIAGNVTVI